MDRIDALCDIEVPRVEYEKLSDSRLGEASATIRARVEKARERQHRRFQDTEVLANADTPAPGPQGQVGRSRRAERGRTAAREA